VADRRGDLLMLQDQREAAKSEYQKALAGLDKTLDYRRLVEAKLATLGVATPEDATAGATK
jgi:predicted negative regulator of RcsB-dependent stress response